MASFIPSEMSLKMGEMLVNNESLKKVDCIARIDVYGFWYYSIFRRYNSPYDIMVEDIHKNVVLLDTSATTIRQIMKRLMNMSDIASCYMYIAHNCSMEHMCGMEEIANYGLDRSLLDIQKLYSGIYINIEGVIVAQPEEIKVADLYMTVQISKPDPADSFYQAASDSADMSMRAEDVSKRHRTTKRDYMFLRSGRKVYKD